MPAAVLQAERERRCRVWTAMRVLFRNPVFPDTAKQPILCGIWPDRKYPSRTIIQIFVIIDKPAPCRISVDGAFTELAAWPTLFITGGRGALQTYSVSGCGTLIANAVRSLQISGNGGMTVCSCRIL